MQAQVDFRHIKTVLALLASCLAASCGDYTIQLQDGYQLVRVGGGSTFVLESPENQEILVGPSVTSVRDLEHALVGKVEMPYRELIDGYRLGYFILEKDTGTLSWGLSGQEWTARLEDLEISPPPKLVKPNRFHQWFPGIGI